MIMDLESLLSLVVLVTTIVGSHALLRKELTAAIKAEVGAVRAELEVVRADIRRLDDRVYGLAAGMKPLIEQAERPTPGT